MRIRFQTTADVFAAFPTLHDDVLARPCDDPPMRFLEQLVGSPTPEDAITFFAYLAPRRDAVWWGCRCVRALGIDDGDAALGAAEDWVAQPEEARRVKALATAESGSSSAAPTWAAYAAAWSGGNIANRNQPAMLAAPYLTAKAARACVLIAISSAPAKVRQFRLERCFAEALRVAADDIEAHFG